MSRGPELSGSGLKDELRTADPGPVYLVVGDESLLRAKVIGDLTVAVVKDEDPSLLVDRVDASSSGWPEILEAARSLSLFGGFGDHPSRVVWVSRAEHLLNPPSPPDDETPEEKQARLEREKLELVEVDAYLSSPVAATCLVLEATAANRGRRGYRLLAKHGVVVRCGQGDSSPQAWEREVREWLTSEVEGRGFRLDANALDTLLDRVGPSPTSLRHEVDKLVLLLGEPGTIGVGDIEELAGRSRDHSVFEMTDGIVQGHTETALVALNRLIDDGEQPIALLGMLAWTTRQMIQAQDLASRGLPEQEILKGMKGPWPNRKTMLRKARRAGRERLLDLLAACGEADVKIKGTRQTRRGADRHESARGFLERWCRRACEI